MRNSFEPAIYGEYCEYGTKPEIPQHLADWVFTLDMTNYNICREHLVDFFDMTRDLFINTGEIQLPEATNLEMPF